MLFFLSLARPMEPPPKPPGTKAPPPRPIKSVSNSNLSNLPFSLGPGGDHIQPPSRNNVAITGAQSETHLAIMNHSPNRQPHFDDAPPLPPHRNPPAVPKQPPVIKPVVSSCKFIKTIQILQNLINYRLHQQIPLHLRNEQHQPCLALHHQRRKRKKLVGSLVIWKQSSPIASIL